MEHSRTNLLLKLAKQKKEDGSESNGRLMMNIQRSDTTKDRSNWDNIENIIQSGSSEINNTHVNLSAENNDLHIITIQDVTSEFLENEYAQETGAAGSSHDRDQTCEMIESGGSANIINSKSKEVSNSARENIMNLEKKEADSISDINIESGTIIESSNAVLMRVLRDKMETCSGELTKISSNNDISETRSHFSSYDSVKDPPYKKKKSSSSDSTSSSSGSTSSSSSSKSSISPSTSDRRKSTKKQNDVVGANNMSNGSPTMEKKRRGRKRKADPSSSIKATAKRLRNAGLAYTSNSKKNKVTVPQRSMGPICTEKCKLKCYLNITDCQCQQIFTAYWKLGCLQRQREFLSSNILTIDPKYSYKSSDSNRAKNSAFYFMVDEKRIRVCKPFFRSTLGISDRPIRTVINKRRNSPGGIIALDSRGNHGNHKKLDISIKNGIRKHIESVPGIESHYCRVDTTKKYIDGGKSVADLHRDYLKDCEAKQEPHGNYVLYHRIFTSEYNISFFQPKKDECEECTAYFNASEEDKVLLKHKYDSHHEEKILTRQEKEKDKANIDDSCVVAVYDLQETLPCPRGDVSTFYYLSKINTLNFTVYDLKTNAVQCFVWYEGQGMRGITEIGSCVYKYLESLLKKVKDNNKLDVIFFSDNCCGEQKNHYMIAMYLYAISNLSFLNSITHKFLIKGHTQNEGDSAHSIIERRIKRCLKSGPIYTPDQYINLIRTAKCSNPYQVHEMSHDSFYDIKKLSFRDWE